MTAVDAAAVRADLQRAAEDAGDCPAGRFAGRGIVVCAGGPVMLTNAYVLVRVLREIQGSRLPIEIWHAGPAEMPEVMAGILEDLGCRLVDGLRGGAAIHDGWALKTRALVDSAFAEVLLLDADQVPLIDPAAVFDWPEFRETGAVFWPDIVDLAEENPLWPLIGVAPRRVRSWESGQVCIDKRRCWQALAVVRRMNERAELFYQLIYGDKDTFLAAWAMTGAGCAVVPHRPFRDRRFVGQRSFEGALVFQHRTNCKFELHTPPIRPDNFLLQAECEAMLDDLRRVWNGSAFVTPPRSLAARRLERGIADERCFELFVEGRKPVPVELLPGHQIGEGRSASLQNWHVEEHPDGVRLVLHDLRGPRARLDRDPGGGWRGGGTEGGGPALLLVPARAGRAVAEPGPARTLADDLIQAALAVPGAPDLDRLAAALVLLAPSTPGVAEGVRRRAAALADGFHEIAEALAALAERLPPPAEDRDMRPAGQEGAVFSRPGHYVWPPSLGE